ncbi:urease accessory protein UreF [Aeribacillus composti]|jgi:Urease accessory protein UreF|uniref:urease accessory protein UreF n=1 Tax=Aeribacillus TaxID=1055323 RepID=UPI0007B46371|nr:urease accessory protein UreF [Aeribacillus pallidus]KZM55597.1 urease accessory protein UreF [Aeribacillus pallidus]
MIDWLPLLQICDSNFPSGAFSHSFGFETYIVEQKIKDASTFKSFLKTYIDKQLVYTDGLVCRLAYQFEKEGKQEELWKLDEILYASSMAKETKEGNRRIGEQMLKLCLNIYPHPTLQQYAQKIKAKELYGHAALVFAIVGIKIGADEKTTLVTYLYSTIQTLVQNGVRGIPIGQKEGQLLLKDLQEDVRRAVLKIGKLSIDDLGAQLPGLEIAQMRHEQLHVRLFMS